MTRKLNHYKIKKKVLELAKEYNLSNVATMLSYAEVLCVHYDCYPKARILVSDPLALLPQCLILNKLWLLEKSKITEFLKTGVLEENQNRKMFYVPRRLGEGLSKAIEMAEEKPRTQIIVILHEEEYRSPQTLLDLQLMVDKKLHYLLPMFVLNTFEDYEPPRYQKAQFGIYYNEYAEAFEGLEGKRDADKIRITDEFITIWESNMRSLGKAKTK